jgi:hypothetical protein
MKFKHVVISALFASMVCLPQALWAAEYGEGDSRHYKRHNHRGSYQAGDFHNHTTFTDGSTSIQRLIYEAVDTYGLDWFGQSGHGGAWGRDGRLDDFRRDCNADGQGDVWDNTVGVENIKGDPADFTSYCGSTPMWRWQSLQEFAYPKTIEKYYQYDKPIWQAYEYLVPGHEHCSVGVIHGQHKKNGNADALAKFEYLFDYTDNDSSEGDGQGWTGKIANIPDGTDAGYEMHEKAVASVEWLQENYPKESYIIWAHIERKGPFDPNKAYNAGFNAEHFRDFNNAGPDVAFGFEGQPGHQASTSRGGFGSTAFGGTRGGSGKYIAEVGGLWDALLGEGRNWFNFASSDWHDRGRNPFLSYDLETTNDFWPGEFQKDYLWIAKKDPKPQDVIDAMRSGNSFTVMGDLIDDLEFTISEKRGKKKAVMGETLKVKSGSEVTLKFRVHDPEGKNHSIYKFNNPSLLQMGIEQPLNMPELNNVQLICGDVTGYISPESDDYTKATNDNMWPVEVIDKEAGMVNEGDGWYSFEMTVPADGDFYCRLRGTNLPPGTPYETYPLDTDPPPPEGPGGPMYDIDYDGSGEYGAENIPCDDTACPPHIGGFLNNDVEAWADLWFYTNPIFVDVK